MCLCYKIQGSYVQLSTGQPCVFAVCFTVQGLGISHMYLVRVESVGPRDQPCVFNPGHCAGFRVASLGHGLVRLVAA